MGPARTNGRRQRVRAARRCSRLRLRRSALRAPSPLPKPCPLSGPKAGFFPRPWPLLRAEVRQTREAMRTRGAGGLLNPTILYRAFLIPLMVRLVNLSDTLALSVETRGFTTYPAPYTVYRPVYLQARDGAFAVLSALCAMGAVLL